MDADTIAVIVAVALVGVGLAGLILTVTGRMTDRLTAVEKETARLAGLLEGLGLAGRVSPPKSV